MGEAGDFVPDRGTPASADGKFLHSDGVHDPNQGRPTCPDASNWSVTVPVYGPAYRGSPRTGYACTTPADPTVRVLRSSFVVARTWADYINTIDPNRTFAR